MDRMYKSYESLSKRRFSCVSRLLILTIGLVLAFPAASLAAVPEGATLTVEPVAGEVPKATAITRDAVSGERFIAGPIETLEILFSDGSSITLAPAASVYVDTYAYDRNSRLGQLDLRVEQGLVRVGGGILNNTAAISITTPQASLRLDNGAAIVAVDQDRTRAHLLYGRELAVTSGGETETLVRPGYEIVSTSNGAPPSTPTRMAAGAVAADLYALNPGLLTGVAPAANGEFDGEGEEKNQDLSCEDLGQCSSATAAADSRVVGDVGDGTNRGPTGAGGGATQGSSGSTNASPAILAAQNMTGVIFQEIGVPIFDRTVGVVESVNDDGGTRTITLVGGEVFVVDPTTSILNIEPGTDVVIISELQDEQLIATTVIPIRDTGKTANRVFFIEPEIVENGQDDSNEGAEEFQFRDSFTQSLTFDEEESSNLTGPNQLSQTSTEGGNNQVIYRPAYVSTIGDDAPKLVYLFFTSRQEEKNRGFALVAESELVNGFVPALGVSGPVQLYFEKTIASDEVDDDTGDSIPVDVVGNQAPGQGSGESADVDNAFLSKFDGKITSYEIPTFVNTETQDVNTPFSGEASEPVEVRILQSGFNWVENDDPDSDIVTRNNDNFLAIQLIKPPSESDNEISPDAVQEQFFFASGDVSGPKQIAENNPNRISVDHFFISGGLTGLAADTTESCINGGSSCVELIPVNVTVGDNIRAFLPRQSAEDLGITTLVDTGLLIITDNSNFEAVNRALHADMGLIVNEDGAAPRALQSTISATVGNVTYSPSNEESDRVAVTFLGRTVGTARNGSASTEDDLSNASTFYMANLQNTAFGGGNENTNLDNEDSGRIGYLVLENTALNGANQIYEGLEAPVGATPSSTGDEQATQYAILRLASANQSAESLSTDPASENFSADRSIAAKTVVGYLAGLAELADRNGNVVVGFLDSGNDPKNFSFVLNPDSNTVSNNPETGQLTLRGVSGTRTITLNGDDFSAYLDDSRFAALGTVGSADPSVAIITGDLVIDEVIKMLPDDMSEADKKAQFDIQHVQWGFFFGETLGLVLDSDGLPTSGQREHAHLASWFAGEQQFNPIEIDFSNLDSTVNATYSGPAIGNVFNSGDQYTAIGSFTNRWNSANGGTFGLDFDGANYSGSATLGMGKTGPTGNFAASTLKDANFTDRTGQAQGSFVGTLNDGIPSSVVGRFGINGDGYAAAGAFGGDLDVNPPQ